MIPIPVSKLAVMAKGDLVGFEGDPLVDGLVLDSRESAPGKVFVAIEGTRVDGHDFAAAAVAAGAAGVLAERPLDVPHIRVKNVVKALASLAASYRERFSGPVVGITGSTGKTTTKELLAAALEAKGPVLKSAGNRNTEYSSPLTWLDLMPEHQTAVIEMAMRGFGQIAHLASFSQPTIGIITNIGFAHLDQVGSRKGIAKAKGELLEALDPEEGLAILWQGDPYLDILRPKVRSKRVQTFGFTEYADCRITRYQAIDWSRCEIEGTLEGQTWHATLPFVGRHMALDAAAAILAAFDCGVDPAEAGARLIHAQLPPMRMQIVPWKGATLVLDTYNASPPSMINAIETLAELPASGRKLAVIGEMLELGEFSDESHRMVGRALHAHGIQGICFYGNATEHSWNEYMAVGGPVDGFKIARSLEDVARFLQGVQAGDSVLVKGSRALELERAVEAVGAG